MALNPEVEAYAARIDEATTNVAADITEILSHPTTSLSDEDRARLEGSVKTLEALAAER